MKRLLVGCLVGLFAVAAANSVHAAEPLDVIKKAIEAGGGKKALMKYDAATARGKGVVNVQGMEMKYTATWNFHYPDKMRAEIDADAMGMNVAVLQVYNGKQGWQKIGDTEAVEMNADQLAALKTQMQVDHAATLVPLLDTKKYNISPVGESDVKGKKAIGLNVTSKDGLDANFYFDKKTHMLVKQTYQTKSETGQDVMQTVFLTDYKKKQGTAFPMKLEIQQDGKQFVTAEFTEVELKDKIDASTFTKP